MSLLNKALPKEITSYDLLKAFAVITMIIDHIGMYFFPDQIEWRVIGRMSFPAWLFLIGYARSRDINAKLVGGAAVLVVVNMIYGMYIFPLNILFSIIIVRFLLDRITFITNKNVIFLGAVLFICLVLAMPLRTYFEYGTQAFVFALLGYYTRQKGQGPLTESGLFTLAITCALISVILQQLSFGFSGYGNMVMYTVAALVLGVTLSLTKFKAATFPKLTAVMPQPFVFLVQLCGRRALEIYVLHLVLFKTMSFFMYPEKYDWLQFSLFYQA